MDRSISIYDIFFIIMLYALFLIFALNYFGWIIDDLYIYFRYVNNFVTGKGLVYNPGEFTEGYSGFSWLMFLSVFGFLNLPLEVSAKVTSLLLAFLNLLLVFKISLRLNLGKLSYLTCILTLFNLPFILWSVSGFEIMLYVFLLLTTFYKIINLETSVKYLIVISMLLFLISVTRPEGVLMSLTFLAFIYIYSGNKIFSYKSALIYFLLLALFLAFRLTYYGDLLPNTYYAKIGHGIIGEYEFRSYRNGIFYVLEFFRHNFQFLLPLILIPFVYGFIFKNKFFLFILTLIFMQMFFVIFAGGDWMIQYRFIVPAIPFLSLTIVFCLNEILVKRKIKIQAEYLITGLTLIIISFNLIREDKFVIHKETELWNTLKDQASDIKGVIPAGSYVANGASGIIPFYLNDVVFLDVVGLTNKTIAKSGYRTGSWFERSMPDYVYDQKPEWLIMWKRKNNNGVFTFKSASPCYFDLSENENFNKYSLQRSYDVYEDTKLELYKLNDISN